MQIGYFCFHDADIAPRRANLLETNRVLDEIVPVIKQEMARTGIRCLWARRIALGTTSSSTGRRPPATQASLPIRRRRLKKP
jgi:xylose isomerase